MKLIIYKSARLYFTYTQIKPPYFLFQTLFMFSEKLQTLKNDSRLDSATTFGTPCTYNVDNKSELMGDRFE